MKKTPPVALVLILQRKGMGGKKLQYITSLHHHTEYSTVPRHDNFRRPATPSLLPQKNMIATPAPP
jgi:hypothetical protein